MGSPEPLSGVLVVVPCGQRKIWGEHPDLGAVLAKNAYTGAPFKVNRAFAERFGDRWVILSAKYGFIAPDFPIPGPYNVTFKKPSTQPITVDALKTQAAEQGLYRFAMVLALGGREYLTILRQVFQDRGPRLCQPYAGLSLGRAMQAVTRAISEGHPC
ncbi:MAG TPA: hypothetical protein VJK02_17295 [Anaerolineales bacterium]|nr:hypothetical protein [Anaerolineales bacterium]